MKKEINPGPGANLDTLETAPLPKDRGALVETIRQKIGEIKRLEKDITHNEELKIEASNDLKIAATPGISVTESRKRILDARLTIDLCDAKDTTLFETLQAAKADLFEVTRNAAAKFNNCVYRARDIARDKIVAAQRAALGSDEALRAFWNHGGQALCEAALHRFNEYEFPSIHFMRQPGNLQWSEKNCARLLLAHVERHAEAIGVDLKNF